MLVKQGLEIERRFLWNYDCPLDPAVFSRLSSCVIKDIYLTDLIRVRNIDNKWFLTIKGEGQLIRDELEYSLDIVDLFKEDVPKLTKTRYKYCFDEHIFEVNYFDSIKYKNNPLCLIECELEAEDEIIYYPYWVGAEVTLDKRFNGYSLYKLLCTGKFQIEGGNI